MVDNTYEFQHSSSRADCTFLMQDSRVQLGRKHVCQLKAIKLQSVETSTTSHVPSQPGPEKVSAQSPSSSRVIGLLIGLYKLLAKWGDQSVFAKFHIACCSCFAPCSCVALALLAAVMVQSS